MQSYIDTFAKHGITLTPAGIWDIGSEGLKYALDAKRVDYLKWTKYPDDNMARHFLRDNNLLVFDIDGEKTIIKDNSIDVPALGIKIPIGLYSTTTKANKYHVYYKMTEEQEASIVNRLKGLHGLKIDIFTYGVIFEAHEFSEHAQLHDGEILPLPVELYECIIEYQQEEELSVSKGANKLGLTSNVQRLNLVNAFLGDKLTKEKHWNKFYRSVVSAEYQPKTKRGLNISKYPFSYDIVNKIAVKLTTTSELDFNEHVVPALRKLLELWEINPDSKKSQGYLYNNILGSLPQHEAIFKYNLEDDNETFQKHIESQPDTMTPIFRTIHKGKIFYIEVDRFSQTPVMHNREFFLDLGTAQALHPEREIFREDGAVIGWDTNVPIIYTVMNPYLPQYMVDEKYDRHTLNLYSPTDYVLQSSASSYIREDNLLYKVVKSTIGDEYLDLYLAYSAQIVFGDESPTLVLWMAALDSELGGSGKSVVTLEIFSLMVGSAAAAVDVKTVSSGWGDIISSTKLLSLEDKPEQTHKEWELTYANIKQQNTNSYRKLNMKHGAVISERTSVSITGSTNHRPKLPASDRRFLCLEPAHFHGLTEPLNEDDRLSLAKLLASHEHSSAVQEYTDYLLGLYNLGFSQEIENALFIEAPQTEYRKKWVTAGATNSLSIVLTLSHPYDLFALVKYDEMSQKILVDLLSLIVHTYDSDLQKSAVSWKWFEAFLPFVVSDKYVDVRYSKANISSMLHIDFGNVGEKYHFKWKKQLPDGIEPSWSRWPTDGHTFFLNDEKVEQYRTIIKGLL